MDNSEKYELLLRFWRWAESRKPEAWNSTNPPQQLIDEFIETKDIKINNA